MLTGDTVLGRGTTVVAHPDGELGAYLDSLYRLHRLAAAHEIAEIWPGHGPVITDALARSTTTSPTALSGSTRSVRAGELRAAPHPEGIAEDDLPRQIVELVYPDVDPVLWGAAELSVRAQLAHLAHHD